ncbi:Hypothetical predicted protein [Pelobates cultripes]|uniref:Uncharacterized protein n=1 Tax=Pelobates cultripes TaxID=61616 RepID=A0AAD1RTN6_PELCU|nr:Hypothetical predicted protein [Pelobates cultripes]
MTHNCDPQFVGATGAEERLAPGVLVPRGKDLCCTRRDLDGAVSGVDGRRSIILPNGAQQTSYTIVDPVPIAPSGQGGDPGPRPIPTLGGNNMLPHDLRAQNKMAARPGPASLKACLQPTLMADLLVQDPENSCTQPGTKRQKSGQSPIH